MPDDLLHCLWEFAFSLSYWDAFIGVSTQGGDVIVGAAQCANRILVIAADHVAKGMADGPGALTTYGMYRSRMINAAKDLLLVADDRQVVGPLLAQVAKAKYGPTLDDAQGEDEAASVGRFCGLLLHRYTVCARILTHRYSGVRTGRANPQVAAVGGQLRVGDDGPCVEVRFTGTHGAFCLQYAPFEPHAQARGPARLGGLGLSSVAQLVPTMCHELLHLIPTTIWEAPASRQEREFRDNWDHRCLWIYLLAAFSSPADSGPSRAIVREQLREDLGFPCAPGVQATRDFLGAADYPTHVRRGWILQHLAANELCEHTERWPAFKDCDVRGGDVAISDITRQLASRCLHCSAPGCQGRGDAGLCRCTQGALDGMTPESRQRLLEAVRQVGGDALAEKAQAHMRGASRGQ